MGALLLTCGLLAVPVVTHILPACVVYFWLFLPVPTCISFVFLSGGMIVAASMHKRFSEDRIGTQDAFSQGLQKGTQVFIQLLLTLLVQSSVCLMVRVYAGEVSSGSYLSYFTPFYNDFMSRTWYTVAQCDFKSVTAFADLLLK